MFTIVGMGPGHPDYVLPAAKKALDAADMIIGGVRHLEPFQGSGKVLVQVEGQLTKLPEIIRRERGQRKIAVAVSGDTGFYSLLSYMKKNFPKEDFTVIPGISSLQYMYSRIGHVHQNSYLGSVHGRSQDIAALVRDNESVGLLTDQKNTPAVIAMSLIEAGLEDVAMYVGENLSYENETITTGTPREICSQTFSELNVVILRKA